MLSRQRASAAVAVSVTALALIAPGVGASHPFSRFEPLKSSTTCTAAGGNPNDPLTLPPSFSQDVIASEPQFPDFIDMNTVNETGPDAGRYLYRTHELPQGSAAVTVTDLSTITPEDQEEQDTGETRVLASRADWERFDGIRWTPFGTIIAAEEVNNPAVFPDPTVPQARAGLLYEIDPSSGAAAARPAVGARAHEGIDFDGAGNLYGISETDPGYLYKFVPDVKGDLSSGQLFALKITQSNGDRTGGARWVPLDRTQVQIDSDEAAAAAGATGYARPEDIEIAGDGYMYVAITDEDRVLQVSLPGGRNATVSQYVKAGVNAPRDFFKPDNLVLDVDRNLYITEDPGGFFATGKTQGDDIWVARPGSNRTRASRTVRFASLTDCDAEPTGIYFAPGQPGTLYVNIQHRGGDTLDKALSVRKR